MKHKTTSCAILMLVLSGFHLMNLGGSPVEAELPPEPPPIVEAFVNVTPPCPMPRYNIPLSEQLQKYIWELCEKYELSYEMVLGVIKAESDFDHKAKGVTGDLGLMQLNPFNTMDWLAQKVGISDFDPFNPYHNATAGIWYLAHIRDYWARYGLCQQKTFALILLSYNRGINGAKTYVRNVGTVAYSNSYVKKVLAFKYELEEGN